jgi:hypothetical protein
MSYIVSLDRTLAVEDQNTVRQEPPKQTKAGRRCVCGKCGMCRDNARWERIFQEKFADSEYYTRRFVRQESPLREL